ncbi:hypothetical protein BDQ17DRAFT_866503 [Cyathus striatus]|nr:hypothetical protein BDQ17DRAFT_866503 [Cyathus striatus]
MFLPDTQIDLTTEEHIRVFFSGTPFACKKATELSGGHVNYTFRLYLVTPYRGNPTLILKHAKIHMKYCSSILLDTGRQLYEYEALQRMKSWLLGDSVVTVPTVYFFDPNSRVLILEDAGDWTLKRFIDECDLTTTLAKDIGNALGQFLARLHTWGQGNGELMNAFKDNGKNKEIFTKKFYGNMRSILMGMTRCEVSWTHLWHKRG